MAGETVVDNTDGNSNPFNEKLFSVGEFHVSKKDAILLGVSLLISKLFAK